MSENNTAARPTGRTLPFPPTRRRVHWSTVDAVEQLAFDGGYDLEAGVDDQGDYVAVTTREGAEYRGRLTPSGSAA